MSRLEQVWWLFVGCVLGIVSVALIRFSVAAFSGM